jgi:hypothetical protein
MRRPQHKVSVNIVRSILTIRKILRINIAVGMRITDGRSGTARPRTSGGTAPTSATASSSTRRSKSGSGPGGVSRRSIGLRQTPAANRLSQSGLRTDH